MGNKALVLDGEAVAGAERVTGKLFFVRLNRAERGQHIIFSACFMVLVITGFRLKIPASVVAYFVPVG